MRALLDVNVLIALLDSGHLMHHTAMSWLERELGNGWASCPITQNGVIRIMSQPAYPNSKTPAQVADRLAEACTSPDHAFWPEDINLLSDAVLDWSRILGHRQVTDAYLLAIAARYEGRFVSFDQRIPLGAVRTAEAENLCVIS